jgi:type III secretory pathway component EscT
MAGNLADNLRGVHRPEPMPNVEPGATPLGVLFSLLAAIAFLESGGPSRIVKRLAAPDLTILAPVERVALDLVLGVELALAVLAPVIVAAIVFDLAAALVHRALQPALVGSLLAPLRSMALLAIVALALDRVAEVVALHAASRP